jgi:tetratricopeptide (TPR) repeat protein
MGGVSTVAWVLAATPLLILPGVFFHYDVTPKALVVLGGAAAAAALYRPARPLDWLLGAQALSLLVSTALSTDPALSFAGSNWRRLGLGSWLAVLILSHAASRLPAAALLRAIAASGGIGGLYGIAQYFGWDPLIPPASYRVGEGVWAIVRPPGTLGHAGYFVVFLLHGVFTGLAVAREDPDRRWRRRGAAAGVLCGIAVLLNGSRAGLLGLAAGAAAWGICGKLRITWRRATAAGAVAAGVAAFYFSPAGLPLRARTRWYVEDPGGGGRMTLWLDTLRMAGGRWAAGYGPETYGSQFPRFQSEELARRFPERYFESAHNIFLDALAGQGVPGLAALAALAVWGMWKIGSTRRSLVPPLAASLTANQFVVFTVPTALLFCVTIAIGAGEASREPPRRRAAAPIGVVLAALAVSLGWSDYWLARARAALDAGRVEEGAALHRRAGRLAAPGVDMDLWYSRALYAALAGHPEAFQAAERAAQRSEERPNAWYNLAALYATRNDFAGTERCLRAAMDWAPRWYKPRWMLAQVLEQAGRLEEAEAEARRAVELNGGASPEVRETWERIRRGRQQK